ncbi:MAG TPA: DinB family protein [Bryobacteraceae bacterium]|nr:DinB family protein [Bryobacteraceae bacterium]
MKNALRANYAALTLALLAASTVAAADTLSDAERNEGLAQLGRTRTAVVEATKGLSEAQWKYKPAPDRWSVAEVVEHMAIVEEFLLKNTAEKVMQAPAGNPDRDNKSTDKFVLTAVSDRSQKVQAPEPVVPTGRWTHRESLEQFLKARQRTEEFLKSTTGLRDHVVDSPLGRPLDAYQWVLYISAHTERHTKQLLEVKGHPDFPKM